MTVRYYTDKVVSKVMLASFSLDGGMSIELPFEEEEDAEGRYVTFTVPRLEYWDVIYMK